jgi:TetR/AcrR family transcriptional regulator
MGIEERRERERGERRELILQSAVQVYPEEGYHAATMEKLAQKAELSRATLYLYFKTKEEIFVDAIVSCTDYFGDVLENIYDRRETIKDNLMRELWKGFQKYYSKDPVIFDLTLYFHQQEMLRRLPEELRLSLDRSGTRVYALLSKLMEYGMGQGYFFACDPRTLAEVVWTTFLGIIHLENSKKAMLRKNHLDITWDLAHKILAKGIMNHETRNNA